MTPDEVNMLESAINEVEQLLSGPVLPASEVNVKKKAARTVIARIDSYHIGHLLDRAEGYWPKNPDWVRSEIEKARGWIWEYRKRG